MCVKCNDTSCNGCSGISSVAKYSSDIKYNGSKFACGNNFVINPNQDLNKLVYDLAKSLCVALQADSQPKSFSVAMPPNNWKAPETAPFMGLYFACIETGAPNAGGSVPVIHDQDDFGILGLRGFPFSIDRNICSEDFTLSFIDMPAGFSQGGGNGIISFPMSTWENPSDVISIDWDNSVGAGIYLPILEITTLTCGTVQIPYIIIIG